MLQRKYMEKNRSIARTVSIEAVLQPRFRYAVNSISFDAGVLGEIQNKFHQNLHKIRRKMFLKNAF